jgi:hypothetical protein
MSGMLVRGKGAPGALGGGSPARTLSVAVLATLLKAWG